MRHYNCDIDLNVKHAIYQISYLCEFYEYDTFGLPKYNNMEKKAAFIYNFNSVFRKAFARGKSKTSLI